MSFTATNHLHFYNIADKKNYVKWSGLEWHRATVGITGRRPSVGRAGSMADDPLAYGPVVCHIVIYI